MAGGTIHYSRLHELVSCSFFHIILEEYGSMYYDELSGHFEFHCNIARVR